MITKECMANQIKQLLNKIEAVGPLNKILRLEWPCEPLSILSWLNSPKLEHKFYYSSRDEQFEMGGIGIADCLQGNNCHARESGHPGKILKDIFDQMEARLSADNPYLRYYGGLSFAPHLDPLPIGERMKGEGDEWQDFPNYHFFIPRFEIVHRASQWIFAFNILNEDIREGKINEILNQLEKINFESAQYSSPLKEKISSKSPQNIPDKKEWEDIFTKIKHRMEKGDFEKIVLARKTTYEFNEPLNPWNLLACLKEKTRACFHFCLTLNDQTAFLGASPERLFKREGRNIQTEALAGTKPRGKNNPADQQQKEELKFSLKDNQEHLFVVNFIKDILKTICSSVKFDKQPKIFEQNAGHHLITQFNGILKPQISDDQIIFSLHPTPAVGGYPKDKALKCIKKFEPFDRGWYAGILGFVGYEEAEFCVAIRSGLVSDKKLALYAGAGIVKESTMEGEWNEIEEKIKSFNVLS